MHPKAIVKASTKEEGKYSRNARPDFSDSADCAAEAEKNDLLAYEERGRDATVLISGQMAGYKSSRSLGRDSGTETSEDAVVAERSRFEHRLISLDFFFLFDQAKRKCPSGTEDGRECGLAKEKNVLTNAYGKDVGGKGMCVPDVETQCIASLRRKRRSKHSSTVQRGEAGIPRSIQAYLQRWLSAMLPIENKAYGLKPVAYSLIFVSLLFSLPAPAQSRQDIGAADGLTVGPLGLGRNVPADFWTREHLFYVNGDTVRRTLEEHRGKMLVLDFWFSGCFNCLLHQKEIAYFRELYADELAVVMVNSKGTREDYDRIVKFTDSKTFKDLGLTDFTSIIEDGYLEGMFVHYGFPHYVWINGRGVFQLQTFRNLLDRDYRTPFIDIKR